MFIYVNEKPKEVRISSGDIMYNDKSNMVYILVEVKHDRFLVVNLKTGKTVHAYSSDTTIITDNLENDDEILTYRSCEIKEFIRKYKYKLFKSDECVMNIDVKEN